MLLLLGRQQDTAIKAQQCKRRYLDVHILRPVAGMLLAYHPSNGSTIALMDKLWFGNGVALSPEEDYLLVADSIQMKIHRCDKHWLRCHVMCEACGNCHP
jgi:hypothetical protein